MLIEDEVKVASRVGGVKWGVVYLVKLPFGVQWVTISSWRNWELGEWQSPRKRFAEGHFVDGQCLSGSWAGEMRKTVGCRLHKGNGLGKGMRRKYWKGYNVRDEKERTENGALENTTGGGIQGRESVITSDTLGARWQVGLKPVEDRAMDAEPMKGEWVRC